MGFSTKMGAQKYIDRGMRKYEKGDIKGAIDDYTKALSENPDFAEAFFNRAICWQVEENYDRAIFDYTNAIKSATTYAAAYVNRGGCWQKKGEYKRAIEDFDEALKIKPNDFLAYNNRGISRQKMKEYDLSINDFSRSLEINPHDHYCYYNRSASWAFKGEFKRALEDVEEAIRLKPEINVFYKAVEYLKCKLRDENKWAILYEKARDEIVKGPSFLCGPYPDCTFVINADEHVLLVSWGFFNPIGPTFVSLCVSKIPSRKAHFLFLKMSNPFSGSSTVYSIMPDPYDVTELNLVLDDFFSTNGGDIPIFIDAPSFIFVPENSLIKPKTIKGLLYKALKKADITGLDNCCTLLKKHWCDPWKRSSVERDYGFKRMAQNMGLLNEAEKLKDRTGSLPEWKETEINENNFEEWWSLVTDPEHIKVELNELPKAWSMSIDFQNKNTPNPLNSTGVQEGLEFHFQLYRYSCPD